MLPASAEEGVPMCEIATALTRGLLGWEPTSPRLLDDLRQGHYFRSATP